MLITNIKIGMRIKIKSIEKLLKENNTTKISQTLNFNNNGRMDKYCGKVYKVLSVSIGNNRVHLSTANNQWSWHPKALEPIKKLSFKGIQ